MRHARSVAEAPANVSSLSGLDDCVRVVFFPNHPFSRGSELTESEQVTYTPVSGCAYGSLTVLLLSRVDSSHPFSS